MSVDVTPRDWPDDCRADISFEDRSFPCLNLTIAGAEYQLPLYSDRSLQAAFLFARAVVAALRGWRSNDRHL